MNMKLDDVRTKVLGAKDQIRALGVEHVYVFGSTARGEAHADSDVDIFVDRDPGRFGFMEFTNLGFLLEDILGARVDVGTRNGLYPGIRETAERESFQVF